MTGVLLKLAGNFNIGLGPQQCAILRLAIRLVGSHALVLQIRHHSVDDRFRRTTRGIRERHRVFDLVLLALDTSEDEYGNDVGILLGDPIPAMLKVEPWLE